MRRKKISKADRVRLSNNEHYRLARKFKAMRLPNVSHYHLNVALEQERLGRLLTQKERDRFSHDLHL